MDPIEQKGVSGKLVIAVVLLGAIVIEALAYHYRDVMHPRIPDDATTMPATTPA